jgi:hypothetical protein
MRHCVDRTAARADIKALGEPNGEPTAADTGLCRATVSRERQSKTARQATRGSIARQARSAS